MIAALTSPEYRDLSPRQVVPALAAVGLYLGSEATAYRLLRKLGMQKHRQNRRPPTAKPPEFVATGPNQVFCWDITYLRSPVTGKFFYLYLITDIYCRSIVGARVFAEERDEHAAVLFRGLHHREQLQPGQAVIHADNGAAMRGATLLATLQKLGIRPSFSRPRVSDDNPYVESLFGTMKGRVGYPKKPFGTIEEAQNWVDRFVDWYNNVHRHSALNFVTPATRRAGLDVGELDRRRVTYEKARARHPERWSRSIRNCKPAPAVYLNPVGKRRTDRAA